MICRLCCVAALSLDIVAFSLQSWKELWVFQECSQIHSRNLLDHYHQNFSIFQQRYIDGGLSGIQPLLSESSSCTLTVCPFSGGADICPVDPPCMMEVEAAGAILNCNMANSFRIINALYPLTSEVRWCIGLLWFLDNILLYKLNMFYSISLNGISSLSWVVFLILVLF